ncbi:MAG: PQQ-like beta-propeller repeat protein [Planctomycetota bacterium]|nr:PQQ-like beta-propeller repeat protein [Planctomycetota bacterium]
MNPIFRRALFAMLALLILAVPIGAQTKLSASKQLDQTWSYDFSRLTLEQALQFISDFQKRQGKTLVFQIEEAAKPLLKQRVPFQLKREPLRVALKRACDRLGLIFWEKGQIVKIECLTKLAPPKKLAEPELKALWTRDLKSPSYGSGATADIDGDGKLEIVFGTYYNDEHVYALNSEDGSVLWTHKSKSGPFDASIAIADFDKDGSLEVIAADSATGDLYCLAGKTGEVKWQLKLPSGTDSPPAIADLDGDGNLEIVIGTMWTRDKKGRVCAISSKTRKILWEAKVPGCVQSAPCLVDLNKDGVLDVVVTSWRGDHSVRALSGKNGALLWSYVTAGTKRSMGMYHGVAISKKNGALRIVAANCDGHLYCLDAKGQLIWTKKLSETLFSPPTIADLDGDGEEELIQPSSKHLWVIGLKKGELCWKKNLGANSARGPALVDVNQDGKLDILLGAGRQFFVFSGGTGKVLWKRTVKIGNSPYEKIDNGPIIANFTGSGKLYVFFVAGKGHSGKTQKQNYGRAFCFEIGKGKGSWETFRGNNKRTGRAKNE